MSRQHPKFPRMQKSAFSITYILPHLVVIALVLLAYHYIYTHGLFYNYLDEIYIGIKIFIACDIFLASISSMLAPILALIAGLTLVYLNQDYQFSLYSDAYQLLIMAGTGFIIRFLIR